MSGLHNASVGIAIDIVYMYTMSMGLATVTQESFESQYYITRALFGTQSLFAMTAQLLAPFHLIFCADSLFQGNSSESSPIMRDEVGEHMARDLRPFLHAVSLPLT